MLSWLYDIFVTIVTFVMGLFGFDLKKRSVTFADDVKDTPTESAVAASETAANVDASGAVSKEDTVITESA